MKALKTTVAALALLAGAAGQPALANSMFDRGLQDRTAWEQWFNSLQGDYKTGAFYWAGQRSLPHPGSCQQMDADFYRGCTDAKVKLATTDALRKTEPPYKIGWNSYTVAGGTTTIVTQASPPAPFPTPIPAAPPTQVTVNVAAPPPAPAPEAPVAPGVRWYTGHMGDDTCVPVDDIGDDGHRLAFGAGSMKTPEDFVRWMSQMGSTDIVRDPRYSAESEGAEVFKYDGGRHVFVFFNNKDICQQMMATLEAGK